MSYILDALKRADAERERGHVPGLHTHNVLPSQATPQRKVWPTTAWLLVALAVAVATGGAAWWFQTTPTPNPRTDPHSPESAPEPVLLAPAMPAQVEAAAPSTDPSVQATASTTPSQAVLPLLAPPAPAPQSLPTLPEPTRPAASLPPANPSATAPKSTVDAPPPTTAPVRSFAELSAEARAQLPVVNVNGSTYSQNPALRMLIANGKVVQEGQEIAPGLVLETIGPRSAVLNHQGLRYSVGY